jgi:hypothetical protein
VRGIQADIREAQSRVRRYAGFGVSASSWVVWQVVGDWVTVGEPQHARLLLCASAVALVLGGLLLRRWRPAGTAQAVWGAVAAVWLAVSRAHPFYVAYAALLGALGALGVWELSRLRRLAAEFAATWTPHEVRAGDVYTVRDGAQFGVVKVLAVGAGRVHVRQYALRYPERPPQVKTSTLERAAAVGGAGAFAHLPLDGSEFVRWAPVLLRSEPLAGEELRALAVWRAVHGEDGPIAPVG